MQQCGVTYCRRRIALFALCCVFAVSLSACFESDTAPSLDPKHLVVVPGFQGTVKIFDEIWHISEAAGHQYKIAQLSLAAGTKDSIPLIAQKLLLLPLHIPDTPGEHFLAIAAVVEDNGDSSKQPHMIYRYFELIKIEDGTFAVTPFLLKDSSPEGKESIKIAARHGVTISVKSMYVTKIEGRLTSGNLQLLFNNQIFRAGFFRPPHPVEVLSDAQITTPQEAATRAPDAPAASATPPRPDVPTTDTETMFQTGWNYHQGNGVPKDYNKAFAWFHRAADNGDPRAMYLIGVMYEEGQGVSRDLTKAVSWYQKGAKQNEPNPMYSLGRMYHFGLGVQRDQHLAAHWVRKAAELGHWEAMRVLGVWYYDGNGVPQDYASGMRWLKQAAVKGQAAAMRDLGVVYLKGIGTLRSISLALDWFAKAQKAGDPEIRKEVDWILANLNLVANVKSDDNFWEGAMVVGGLAAIAAWLAQAASGNSDAKQSSGTSRSDYDAPSDYERQQEFYKEREKYWHDCATWKELC